MSSAAEAALAAEHRDLSSRVADLDAVIAQVEGFPLKPAEEALYEKYREHRARLQDKLGVVDRELGQLRSHSHADVPVASASG
jgi:hypothetical protein